MPNVFSQDQIDKLNAWPRTQPSLIGEFPFAPAGGVGFGDLLDSAGAVTEHDAVKIRTVDVDSSASSITSGQVLEYNGTVYVPVSGTNADALDGKALGDLSAISSGELLEWNGSAFVAVAGVNADALDGKALGDLSGITSNQIIAWTGSEFEPRDYVLPEGLAGGQTIHGTPAATVTTEALVLRANATASNSTTNEGNYITVRDCFLNLEAPAKPSNNVLFVFACGLDAGTTNVQQIDISNNNIVLASSVVGGMDLGYDGVGVTLFEGHGAYNILRETAAITSGSHIGTRFAGVYSNPSYTVDHDGTSTVDYPAMYGVLSSPLFQRAAGNTGTQTIAAMYGFATHAGGTGTVNTGCTVDEYVHYSAQSVPGSGTITSEVGLDLPGLDGGSTLISIRSATAATFRHAGYGTFGLNDDTDVTIGGSAETSVLRAVGDDVDDITLLLEQNQTTTPPTIKSVTSRGTNASQTATVTGDTLLDVVAHGHDGTDYEAGARLQVISAGTITAGEVPAYFRFDTRDDGAASLTEAARLTESNQLLLSGRYGIEGDGLIISSDQDDYDPSQTVPTGIWKIDVNSASSSITGIVPKSTSTWGEFLTIINTDSTDLTLTLAHENTDSSAANRIVTPTERDLVLHNNQSATLWYDVGTDRWKVINHTGAAIHQNSAHFGVIDATPTVDRFWPNTLGTQLVDIPLGNVTQRHYAVQPVPDNRGILIKRVTAVYDANAIGSGNSVVIGLARINETASTTDLGTGVRLTLDYNASQVLEGKTSGELAVGFTGDPSFGVYNVSVTGSPTLRGNVIVEYDIF
jgi:hypothetical protein